MRYFIYLVLNFLALQFFGYPRKVQADYSVFEESRARVAIPEGVKLYSRDEARVYQRVWANRDPLKDITLKFGDFIKLSSGGKEGLFAEYFPSIASPSSIHLVYWLPKDSRVFYRTDFDTMPIKWRTRSIFLKSSFSYIGNGVWRVRLEVDKTRVNLSYAIALVLFSFALWVLCRRPETS